MYDNIICNDSYALPVSFPKLFWHIDNLNILLFKFQGILLLLFNLASVYKDISNERNWIKKEKKSAAIGNSMYLVSMKTKVELGHKILFLRIPLFSISSQALKAI